MIAFSNLQAGSYLLTRRFGKNYLYRVVSAPAQKGWQGWRVEVRAAGKSELEDRVMARLLYKLGGKSGQYILRLSYYVRLWSLLDVLCGRPRMIGFATRDEAIHQMWHTQRDVALLDSVIRVVAKVLPRRLAIYVVMVIMAADDAANLRRRFTM
jgi:hypothetical protein